MDALQFQHPQGIQEPLSFRYQGAAILYKSQVEDTIRLLRDYKYDYPELKYPVVSATQED